ncbi:MAG TPA: serine/threonine protein kinase [Gemmataceae bacterium]|nr:serine/threonine protein kinase [Gemmataceae bacterium]
MFGWLKSLFRRSETTTGRGQVTIHGASAGRATTRSWLLSKKRLWIWPIIAVVLLTAVGFVVGVAIERTMNDNLRSELETVVTIQRSMLATWLNIQESNAQSLANDPQVRQVAAQILPTAGSAATSVHTDNFATTLPSLQARFTQELTAGMSAHHFVRYILADQQQRIVAATSPELLGQTIPQYESFLRPALEGRVTVSAPFPSVVVLQDEDGITRSGVATMFVAAPIYDENKRVIAALALRIRPEQEFTQILQMGRLGKTGETYAINKDCLMVSGSRFDDQLTQVGLLPDTDGAQSILNISVRDPGGDMTRGFRPKIRRAEQPLTQIAAAAISGGSGVLINAYNDYRGVRTVGAYTWLPKYDIGIITEIDHAEAYRPLAILHWAFYSMFGLLALSSGAIFVFTLVVARLEREAQKAAIEARRLGQYRLEEKLGSGGMGVVYKGHHALLRRPTAIKMLNPDLVDDVSISRFEREVQTTCRLNNPNTVAIYDYGRTHEGVFYYAMEYLDGIDLQNLVDRYGPQPEGRVIHILKAICSSLAEAHSLGLVHRDIKPANVMLNRRGGECDVVKVLDFGLVKALNESKITRQSSIMAGTPLYMSPEAIQKPELVGPRSDLYAVGATGYFLITGQPVFTAHTLVDLCHDHVTTIPEPPSRRLGKTVSPELEAALLCCLAKNPDQRPQTAHDLSTLLSAVPTATSWSDAGAAAWWRDYEEALAAAAAVTRRPPPKSQPVFGATVPIIETQSSSAPRYLDQSIGTADAGIA